MRWRILAPAISTVFLFAPAGQGAQRENAPQGATIDPGGLRVPPPRFPGKALLRDPAGGYRLRERRPPVRRALGPLVAPLPESDVYLDDGAETSLALRPAENRLVASYNDSWSTVPATPHGNSDDGNRSWTIRAFPPAKAPFTSYPFDPWSFAGNARGEFFTCMIWLDEDSFNSHCLVARSIDGGGSFSAFFELQRSTFQDRDMADVDRDEAGGGGPGKVHDGSIFIGYDDWGPGGSEYRSSLVQVVSAAGAARREIRISGSGAGLEFRGVHPQPVAGVTDGTAYVQTLAIAEDLVTNVTAFHELRNGGEGPNVFEKSSLRWRPGGQDLGEGYLGLNGFRIDDQGYLAMDRTPGARRGHLYFIANRNPNPTNTKLDQGDIVVSVSTDEAATWSTVTVPTGRGKTQFFPMLDVDGQGFLHVAYYQNESGSANGGVLNADTANVYYTLSTDGARTWSAPVRVNQPANTLRLPDPPPNRSDDSFYLIGDYAQLKAAATASGVRAYVLWAGYDDRRSGDVPGQTKERVLCTSLDTKLGFFLRGDANFDMALDLADAVFTLSYLFVDPAPAGGGCEPSMDSNGDGMVDLSDAIALVFYLFAGAPAAPSIECVVDSADLCGRSFCY
jgi:hypothetical protein